MPKGRVPRRNGTLISHDDIVKELVDLKIKERASNYTLLEHLSSKYGLKQGQCYIYIANMRDYIAEIYKKDALAEIETAKIQLEKMMEEAKIANNRKLELEIRKEINKLLGLYASEKIDVTSGGESISNIEIKIIR